MNTTPKPSPKISPLSEHSLPTFLENPNLSRLLDPISNPLVQRYPFASRSSLPAMTHCRATCSCAAASEALSSRFALGAERRCGAGTLKAPCSPRRGQTSFGARCIALTCAAACSALSSKVTRSLPRGATTPPRARRPTRGASPSSPLRWCVTARGTCALDAPTASCTASLREDRRAVRRVEAWECV